MREMQRSYCLLLILCLVNLAAEACQCYSRPIKQEIESAEQIFIGKVTERNELTGKVSYKFEVTQMWKGEDKPMITLTTGFGGGDCGMIFQKGQEYLIFSNNGETSRCRPNELLSEGKRIGLVKYHLDNGFQDQLAIDNNSKLNLTEAYYFNTLLKEQRGKFDFTDKNVAFYSNNSKSDKRTYFDNNGGRTSAEQLIILTDAEKQTTGYQAIIVSWRKVGLSKSFRKRLMKELSK